MGTKILIAGGTCSGKSTLAKRIAECTGHPIASFGGCLRDYARGAGLSLTVESLQNLGQGLISQLGYDGFMQWVIVHSPVVQWDKALILEGVRHVAMYDSLKKTFPLNILVYCACDKETQIARMMNRDGISREDVEHILSHPLERNIADLKSHAHLLFHSEDPFEDFLEQLDALVRH